MTKITLDALEHAVARALRDGKDPRAYLLGGRRSGKMMGLVMGRLRAKGAVRYEKNDGITTPIVTDAGRAALEGAPHEL
jgi:hypothetical protein